VITFGPTAAIRAKLVQIDPLQRSIRNPSSWVALFVQDRLFWLFDTTVAVRLPGAAGTAGAAAITALAELE
jgi:hypothetical protein